MNARRVVSTVFLSAFFLFSVADAYVVVDPYSANNTFIKNPVFDRLFLDELYSEKVIPVIGNGTIEFYLAEKDKCFDASGDICTAAFCGSAICGSKAFNKAIDKKSIDYALVLGNTKIHEIIGVQNALRYSVLSSGDYLSLVERNLAGAVGSELEKTYVQERYSGSVDKLIGEEIMRDSEMANVNELLKRGNTNEAIAAADKFFSENYKISTAYDAYDIFSAVREKTIGPMQYAEIMARIMDQQNTNQQNISELLDALMNKSSILNDALNRDALNQALDTISKNPKMFSELEKAMGALDNKLAGELMSRMLEETFRNKELMKKFLEVLPDILNDAKMRESFLKASTEAMREMQETGELDKMIDNLKDASVREKLMNFAKDSAPSFFDAVREKAGELLNQKYALPLLGLIAIFIVSLKVRL